MTVVVQPTAIGTIPNTATVQGDQPDFTPANNRVTITSQVVEEATPPTILAQRPIVSLRAITGIVLTFSKPMDPVQAEALNNYSLRPSGKGDPGQAPAGPSIPFASARYDASRRTVTLTPKQPLSLGRFYELTANGAGASGLTDTAGNVLDGDRNGLPDGIYQSSVGRGTKVRPVPFQRDQLVPIPPPQANRKPRALASRRPRVAPRVQSDISLTLSLAKHMSRND